MILFYPKSTHEAYNGKKVRLMPYKKDKRPYAGIGELIRGKGIGQQKLAKILGVSEVTAWRRLNDIGELKVKDLYEIMRVGHITKEELRERL